jgi:hypothetical protein
MILGVLEQHVFVRSYSAAYKAVAATTDELYTLLGSLHRSKRTKLLEVRLTAQQEAACVDFTLEAQPETHKELQTELRTAFDNHKITSFSSSEQE